MIISDEAICSSVRLSSKYIADRRLPDKAVDLLDEACSKIRVKLETIPEDMKRIDAEIVRIKQAIGNKNSNSNSQLKQLYSSRAPLEEKWKQYKSALKEVNNMKVEIAELKLNQFTCQKLGNFERAKYIEEIELKAKTAKLEELDTKFKLEHIDKEDHFLKSIHIAEIVKSITGIPVGSLLERERKSLLNMEAELCTRVVGQEEAISAICRCIRLSRAGLKFHDRPLGVFLMLGSTGVGKTEVAKALCDYLFHDENAILRVDMSEYMERFSVSRFVFTLCIFYIITKPCDMLKYFQLYLNYSY